jgi:cytochrome c nitrite reductase small subunit
LAEETDGGGAHEAPGRRARRLLPRGRAAFFSVALAVGLGVLGGIGAFTFGYAKGFSYLSNDPRTCTNCHVMQGHYESWLKSSHQNVAVCNDCHLPHDFVGKYWVKADNGLFHSLAFTLDNYPEPIRIKARNRAVTQNACIDCHADFVHHMLPREEGGDMLLCIQCHSDAGHAAERRHGAIARGPEEGDNND